MDLVDYLNKYMDINLITGELRWKESSRNCKKGDLIGSIDDRGYRRVFLKGKHIRIHRLVWLLAYGSFPNEDIDHINGNKLDNSLDNLRLVSDFENLQNSKRRLDNTSGVKGVSWHKQHNAWQARIAVNGVRKSLGYFSSIEDAEKSIREERELLHKEFCNHGDLK